MATFPGSGSGSSTDSTQVAVTWAALQALAKVSENNGLIKCVSDVGINRSYWVYKHASTDWFALSEIYLAVLGTDATHGAPLTTHESALSVKIMSDGTKSIWKNRDILRIRGRFKKTGVVDSIRNAPYFNSSNAIGGFNARDNTASGFATPGVTVIEVMEEIELQRLSATTYRCISMVRQIDGENAYTIDTTDLPTTINLAATSPVLNIDTSAAVWLLNEFWLTGTTDTAFSCFDAHVVLVPKSS
jgi:hypothetical protein